MAVVIAIAINGDVACSNTIYRYKFSNDIMTMITEFAKIHQYDDRKIYKEHWIKWFEENNEPITDEMNRLTRLGYDGDIPDKMFKAGRYYFRKKNTADEKKQQTRRSYITMSSDMLEAMDTHIGISIKNDDFTPASGYIHFCVNHVTLLETEIRRLCSETPIKTNEMIDKIKKTYKNRYFIITRHA